MKIEPGRPFSEGEVSEIERALGRGVSKEYVAFAKVHGDAFVGGLVDGNPSLPILSFLSANRILSILGSYDDLKVDGVLPFANCEVGNLWVMDASGNVHYLNYYGGLTTSERVDVSFDRFVFRIVIEA